MKYIEYYNKIKEELGEVFESIDEQKLSQFVEMISNANKEMGYSAGRMGFGLKAFLMRLNHLGINAYWFGDNYIPPMDENDVFICCSNSGTTKSVASIFDIFKNKSHGKTVAFVAASRAEKNKMTPEATETTPGILRCYDTTKFKEVIAEADENAVKVAKGYTGRSNIIVFSGFI